MVISKYSSIDGIKFANHDRIEFDSIVVGVTSIITSHKYADSIKI